jgi:Tfp pilus tip-associated adhesin PilY1
VTGVCGDVAEPYLQSIAHPEYLMQAYYVDGRCLGESMMRATVTVAWTQVIVGDPLATWH